MIETPAAVPPWALGYEIPFLKDLVSLFKKEFKQHTYGAFGIPNERDLATALRANEVLYNKDRSAVAIIKLLQSGSRHEDFSGTLAAQLKRGDIFIKHIAGGYAEKKRIIEVAMNRGFDRPTWAEVHCENNEMVQLLESLGFKHVLTKVSASSDIKGLFLRGDPAGRIPGALDKAELPGLKCIKQQAITNTQQLTVLRELAQYEATKPWAQHYSNYNVRQSWTAFCLKGYDAEDPGFIIKPAEMSKQWKADNPLRMKADVALTPAVKKMPRTWEILLDVIDGDYQRVRLMRLSANGGELSRHADITDPEAGVRDGCISRLHIPLKTHKACQFRSWDLAGNEDQKHFHERGLFYLDTRKPHAVINSSDSERIHLVVDVYSSEKLRERLRG